MPASLRRPSRLQPRPNSSRLLRDSLAFRAPERPAVVAAVADALDDRSAAAAWPSGPTIHPQPTESASFLRPLGRGDAGAARQVREEQASGGPDEPSESPV